MTLERHEYEYINPGGYKINGDIYPVRTGATENILLGEDIAYLSEQTLMRYCFCAQSGVNYLMFHIDAPRRSELPAVCFGLPRKDILRNLYSVLITLAAGDVFRGIWLPCITRDVMFPVLRQDSGITEIFESMNGETTSWYDHTYFLDSFGYHASDFRIPAEYHEEYAEGSASKIFDPKILSGLYKIVLYHMKFARKEKSNVLRRDGINTHRERFTSNHRSNNTDLPFFNPYDDMSIDTSYVYEMYYYKHDNYNTQPQWNTYQDYEYAYSRNYKFDGFLSTDKIAAYSDLTPHCDMIVGIKYKYRREFGYSYDHPGEWVNRSGEMAILCENVWWSDNGGFVVPNGEVIERVKAALGFNDQFVNSECRVEGQIGGNYTYKRLHLSIEFVGVYGIFTLGDKADYRANNPQFPENAT